MIPPEQRAEIRRPLLRRALARRHHRQPPRCPSRHRPAGDRAGPLCPPGVTDPPEPARPLQGLHHRDPRAVPAAARDPPLRDAPRSGLYRLGRPTAAPCPHRPPHAAGGGLSALGDVTRRAGASRLGPFRYDSDRPCPPSVVVLRPRAVVVVRGVRALRARSDAGELPARPRRGLYHPDRRA